MTKLIPLTRGQYAIVDDADFEWLSQMEWIARKIRHTTYAYTKNLRAMHRLIVNAPVGMEVDHIDSNGLNNTRSNLRICTSTQNHGNARISTANKSGFKGVHWDSQRQKYRAQIGRSPRVHLGYHITAIDAARAYDRAALAHFGEFARLNFPEEHSDA